MLIFLLLLLGFIWGLSYSIARLVIASGITPCFYTFLLTFFPAIILFGLCWKKNLLKFKFNNLKDYLLTSIFGIILPSINKYWLATHLPSGILAIVVGITPFFIYPIALLFGDEIFSVNRMFGVFLAATGIILLAAKYNFSHITFNSWLLISLLIPLSYAVSAVYVAKFVPKKINVLSLTTGMLIVATILLIPFSLSSLMTVPLKNFLSYKLDLIITLEIILVMMGYILLFKILKHYGSVNYSVVDGIGAIVGLICGYCFFHEHITYKIIGATLLIIIGSIIILKGKLINSKGSL